MLFRSVAMVLSGIAALVLYRWYPGLLPTVGLGFVFTFLNAVARPALMAALTEVPDHVRGTVMGLNVTASSIGWMGAAGLGGIMVATEGFAAFGPTIAVVAVLGAALTLIPSGSAGYNRRT